MIPARVYATVCAAMVGATTFAIEFDPEQRLIRDSPLPLYVFGVPLLALAYGLLRPSPSAWRLPLIANAAALALSLMMRDPVARTGPFAVVWVASLCLASSMVGWWLRSGRLRLHLVGCVVLGAAAFLVEFLPARLAELATDRRYVPPPASLPTYTYGVLAIAAIVALLWRGSTSRTVALSLNAPAFWLAPWATPHGDGDGLWVLVFPGIVFFGIASLIVHAVVASITRRLRPAASVQVDDPAR